MQLFSYLMCCTTHKTVAVGNSGVVISRMSKPSMLCIKFEARDRKQEWWQKKRSQGLSSFCPCILFAWVLLICGRRSIPLLPMLYSANLRCKLCKKNLCLVIRSVAEPLWNALSFPKQYGAGISCTVQNITSNAATGCVMCLKRPKNTKPPLF